MSQQEAGAVGVEYALVIGLISLLIVAAVVVLGDAAVDYIHSIDLGLPDKMPFL